MSDMGPNGESMSMLLRDTSPPTALVRLLSVTISGDARSKSACWPHLRDVRGIRTFPG